MPLYTTLSMERRERYVPDVIAAENDRRRIVLHQFVGQGIEVGIWRINPEGEWVRSKEALRLKKWEAIGLIRSMVTVLKEREGKRLPSSEVE